MIKTGVCLVFLFNCTFVSFTGENIPMLNKAWVAGKVADSHTQYKLSCPPDYLVSCAACW